MSVALPTISIPENGVAVSLGLTGGQPYAHVELYNASAFTVQITGWSSGNFYLTPGQDRVVPFKSSLGDPSASGVNNASQVGTLYLTGYTVNEPPIPSGTAGSVVSITGGTVNAKITSGTVDANITNATIPVTGSLDANITNASIPVTGSLDANITNASIPVTGTVDANITNSTIDANITNASLAVTGSVTADISNASLAVTGNVDATLTGPVGISSGSTINVVNSAAGGQTPLSQTTTITNAPDTLDSTNYILAALPNANGLPAGSSGNLVYDSNLTNAIATVGATWASSSGVGTGDNNFNVNNAGTSSAEVVWYGTGSQANFPVFTAQTISALPNTEYTLACLQNMSNASTTQTTGSQYSSLRVFDQSGNYITQVNQGPGDSGATSGSFTTSSTVTGVYIDLTPSNLDVPAGQTISWSQIQLTQTSAVQPYEPGPLFNNILFKQDGSNFYYLGETTALALADTGQPLNTAIQASTSINSTVPQLAIPGAPTLSVEGTAGTTTATYGWVTQTTTAQGVVSLASNPGVNIGTIDIADGAAVQLAAGTAVIGTVNAQGQVDVGTIDTITAGSLSIVNQPGINIPSGSEHNYSMTMATAGTSYTAAPAVSTRAFFLIQNASGNNLYFGFGSLGNIFELGPLQGYEEASGKNPLITLAITVQGTIDSQPVSIVTWE